MRVLIVDGPGIHPATTARSLGFALHGLGHGVIVHPMRSRPETTWFNRSALGRDARKVLLGHNPDAVHVLSSDPRIAEAFLGNRVPVIHSTVDRPSKADWLIVPSQAALARLPASGPQREGRAAAIPFAIEIEDETPAPGDYALAVVDRADKQAQQWLKTASAAASHVPVRTEGDPREARFVISISSRAEAWPRGVAEAMAAARPVLAGWGGAAGEFVLEGVTGFLSAPGDVKSLSGHMAWLWDRPGEAMEMGLAGRHEARSCFGAEFQARALLRGYLRAGVSRLAV